MWVSLWRHVGLCAETCGFQCGDMWVCVQKHVGLVWRHVGLWAETCGFVSGEIYEFVSGNMWVCVQVKTSSNMYDGSWRCPAFHKSTENSPPWPQWGTWTRSWLKVGQIGTKWDKSGNFSQQIQYILRLAPNGKNLGIFQIRFRCTESDLKNKNKPNCTESDLKNSLICPIWGQYDPL